MARAGIALHLLRATQLADDYAAAWTDWDDDDTEAWDLSSLDGLND